ncbi:MAG: DUF975 family protein [Clostridia bacterium]|nr:DUF975 family protein [Clostridia bacterium]
MRYASDFRAMARGALKGKWGISVLVCFVASLLGGLAGSGGSSGGSSSGGAASGSSGGAINITPDTIMNELEIAEPAMAIIGAVLAAAAILLICIGLIHFIVGGAVQQGLNIYNIRLIKGETPEFSTLFCRFNNFGKALGLRVVTAIFVALWTLLFIIPGIIKSYAYILAPYIMAEDPDCGVMEALSRSQELMKGNKWRYFCLELSFIGWAILSLFTLGIGSLWLNPYMQAAFAGFYLEVSGQIV